VQESALTLQKHKKPETGEDAESYSFPICYRTSIFAAVVNTTGHRLEVPSRQCRLRGPVVETVTSHKVVTVITLPIYTRQHLCELIATTQILVDDETRI